MSQLCPLNTDISGGKKSPASSTENFPPQSLKRNFQFANKWLKNIVETCPSVKTSTSQPRFCFLSVGWHTSKTPKCCFKIHKSFGSTRRPYWKQFWVFLTIILMRVKLRTRRSQSVFSWPLELVQELFLLLLLKTNSCRAVWVIVGEVRGSFVLRVFQTHVLPSDADSSVHLVEQRKGTERVDTGPKRPSWVFHADVCYRNKKWGALIRDTYSSCWFLKA